MLDNTWASAREKPTRLSDSSMRNWLSRDISKSPESAQESISRRDTTDTLPRRSKAPKSDLDIFQRLTFVPVHFHNKNVSMQM